MTHWRIQLSRWLNARLGGNPRLMLSSRAYIEDRKIAERLINFCFFVWRGENNHCHNSLYLDLEEKPMEVCGVCHHRDELFPFTVTLTVGEEKTDCGAVCYYCARYLNFIANKLSGVTLTVSQKAHPGGEHESGHGAKP